jgi:uncharacterized protein
VVFQAAFFDGRFLGYAAFIIRSEDGRYEVCDTKLARSTKITALLQLAAYSDQLQARGIATGENVHLILGDDRVSTHRLAEILPVYQQCCAWRRASDIRWVQTRLPEPSRSARHGLAISCRINAASLVGFTPVAPG